MKLFLPGPLKDNKNNLMRRLGYHFQGESGQESSFVRPPHGFPRFHIYAREDEQGLAMNLHLDQKRPVYEGTTAHSGEYESEIVQGEADRIKEIINREYQIII
jgi:hypothetical protein